LSALYKNCDIANITLGNYKFSMPRLLEPLWLILATLTDKQLGQTVEFLRE
jgi:hypothetical protein